MDDYANILSTEIYKETDNEIILTKAGITRAVVISLLGEVFFVVVLGDIGVLFTIALAYMVLKYWR